MMQKHTFPNDVSRIHAADGQSFSKVSKSISYTFPNAASAIRGVGIQAFFKVSKSVSYTFPNAAAHTHLSNTAGRKKRIAVIGAKGLPSRVSGLEVYVQTVCAALAEDYDITVFCRKRYCDRVVKEYRGIRIVHIPSVNTKHMDAISYSICATLAALQGGYDLFWYHALGPAITAWLPRLFGKRIACTVHGLDWKRGKFGRIASFALRQGERCAAHCADVIFVQNKRDAVYFKLKWNRDSRVVANGVTEGQRRAARLIRERYGLNGQDYILFLSRLVPEKGAHTLIDAYLKMKTETKLVIAGAGVHTARYASEIERMAAASEKIILTGFVSGALLEEFYSNALLYVLPSTVEGQSIGLLEAMRYGLPCIVSDIPENRETIRDAGVCFAVGDSEDLRKKMEYLLQDREAARRYGESAAALAKSQHDWNRSIRQIDQGLREVMRR